MSEEKAEIARLKRRIESLEIELALYRAVERESNTDNLWEALVSSRLLLQSFLNHTTYGVIIKDCDLRVRFMNSSLQKMLGRSADNVLMQKAHDFYEMTTANQFEEDDHWVITNRKHLEREIDVVIEGAVQRWRIHKTPIIDGNDNLVGLFIAVVDLTQSQFNQDYTAKNNRTDLIPICSSCKGIRNDEGKWVPLEAYLLRRWKVEPTHTICPECARVLYPEINLKSLS